MRIGRLLNLQRAIWRYLLTIHFFDFGFGKPGEGMSLRLCLLWTASVTFLADGIFSCSESILRTAKNNETSLLISSLAFSKIFCGNLPSPEIFFAFVSIS